ncbi:MAG: TIR domain-containing protein, partial [Chloroflexi bacterium]|nr:TIR domain-containing protein [Chloroflexota bacterium]
MAEALRYWLPFVLNAVDPWMSAEDIEAGAKWQEVVSGELHDSNFSIICLTPENLNAPWVLFEAGALSKHGESLVCTYLFDLESQDVKPPLSQFQHSRSDKDGTRKLVRDINKHLGDAAVPEERLTVAFDMWWPKLGESLASIPAPKVKPPKQSDPDRLAGMVAEILNTVREQSRLLQQVAPRIETSPVSQAELFASSKSVETWLLFKSLLAARGHEVSLIDTSRGVDLIGIDHKKTIPVPDAWKMLNSGRNLRQIGRDQAEMLEELVDRYPID